MGTLKGRNAFVTGTSQGIGAAISETLIKAGCNICMHYFSSEKEPAKLQKIAEEKVWKTYDTILTKELIEQAKNY